MRFHSLLVTAAFLFAGSASAQTLHLDLDPDSSTFTSGCWPPCLCPIALFPGVGGSMDLVPTGAGATYTEYDVVNINWNMAGTAVTGMGTFRISQVFGTQETVLDLSFDGQLPVTFQSGSAFTTAAFPDISFAINQGNFTCFDQLFNITAIADPGSSYCVANPNSTGSPAFISGSGSTSVLQNDLTLASGPVQGGETALFYYGGGQAQVPFGNGWRCVGGVVYRLFPIAVANGAGFVTHDLDVTNPPGGAGSAGQITAGSTWNFQNWYRDPMGGGAGFNLSDGLSVTFVP